MKTAFILLFSLSGLVFAQESAKQENHSAGPDGNNQIQFRRLESVTWDLHSHKLVWVVEKGTPHDGEFVPTSQERYEISPGEAMMAVGGEQRGFTEQEAAWLQRLLNVLTIYCAQSVVWWNNGEAVPANPAAPSAEPPAEAPDTAIHKVSLPISKTASATAPVEIAKKEKQ